MFNPQPKRGMPPKKERKSLKRTALKKGKKPTGEKEIFTSIAESREWKCFVTGEPLHELKSTQFAHVLPKAENRYPKFKLYEKNIVLLSDYAHYLWDFGARSELKKDKRFERLFKLEAELLEEYKTSTNL
jgi:hypothetical protein